MIHSQLGANVEDDVSAKLICRGGKIFQFLHDRIRLDMEADRCVAELVIELDKTLYQWIYLLECLFAEPGRRCLSTEQPRHESPHPTVVVVGVGLHRSERLYGSSPAQPCGILTAFRQQAGQVKKRPALFLAELISARLPPAQRFTLPLLPPCDEPAAHTRDRANGGAKQASQRSIHAD